MTDASTTCGIHPEDGGRIALATHCTLRESLALKSLLIERCALHRDIELDGSAVERIDTAGLQLLAAFFLEIGARGQAVRWCGVSDVLRNGARQIGLDGVLGLPPAGEAAR